MEERNGIRVSLSTVLFIIALIVIIVMAYYIYVEKTNTDNENSTLEINAISMQKTIDELKQKIDTTTNTTEDVLNTNNSEKLVTELKLGTYEVIQDIEDDSGIGYNDIGVTLASNNLCSVYEGFGSSSIGTYSIENNKLICNTIIGRGENGGIGYSEGNIVFEFKIMSEDELELVNVANKSNRPYNDIALKSGMTYKLSDANLKVLIDND